MAKVESSPSSEVADSHRLISTGDIELETVSDIEDNLTDCEKVSLVFLLYDNVNDAIERLEMLIGGCKEDSPRINLLEDWAKGGEQYWKETLLEGLAIIKAYREIKDLNFDLQQVKDHFSPNQLNKSIFIHPVKKALFGMCEGFLKKDTENFIRNVLDNPENAIKEHKSHWIDYLELFLLHMMKNEIIKVGTWSSPEMKRTQTQEISKLDIIFDFLKMNDFSSLHGMLNSVKIVQLVNNTNITTQTSSLNEKDEISKYPIIDVGSLGWFLIFNHTTFVKTKPELTDRPGTEMDVIELQKCWSSYGFKPVVFKDFNAEDVLKTINTYTGYVEDRHSAFGVCILSHGNSDGVFARDGNLILKSEIKKSLHTENLVDKPKILLVQACRGENKERESKNKECEEKTSNKDKLDGLEPDGSVNVPEKADLLEFWSTVDNSLAYRHPVTGSLFIQTLCKCLTEHGNTKHLVDIYIKVTDEIGKKNIQISEYVSTLRKHFYLIPNA